MSTRLSFLTLMGSLVMGANAATTIDFNDGTSGTLIGSFYSSLGVTFSGAQWSNISAGYTPHPQSTGLRFIGAANNLQPKVGNPITITFAEPIASLSVIANSVNANGARLELYDALSGGNLIASDQVVGPSGATNTNFTLSATSSGALRAVLYQPFSVESEGVLFDNLTFTPVPEPGVAILTSLAAIGFAARRKRG